MWFSQLRMKVASAYRQLVPIRVRQKLRLGGWFDRLSGRWLIRADFRTYEVQRRASRVPDQFRVGHFRPIHLDRFAEAGQASGHYFHQDLLVAREIYKRNPRRHVDVGSSIYGFVSHVAAFRTIEVIDVRPVLVPVEGIEFVQHDLMAASEPAIGTTDSLSCLHALEHFGLGRYGDPVDYDGWSKGLAGLSRLLEPGGTLYLSVPTGVDQRIEFNAHRVFSLPFLSENLAHEYDVERLAFVDDAGALHDYQDPNSPAAQGSFGAEYGCSIWILRKR
jgi:hypothetical protein